MKEPPSTSLSQLFERYPFVPWREPLPVQTEDACGFGCRICIALRGLKGADVGELPQTMEEFALHMKTAHGL